MKVRSLANVMMWTAALGLGAFLARTMAARDAAGDARRAVGRSLDAVTGEGGPASAVLGGSDGTIAATLPTAIA